MTHHYDIIKLDQLKALSSPVRGEIIDLLELFGPLSIAELAEYMSANLDSLYYHIRILQRVGLVIQKEKRKAARQQEVVFDLPGRPMHVIYQPTETEQVSALIRSISMMLRMAARNIAAAFAHKLVFVKGRKRNVIHARTLGWFTDDEIVELQNQINKTISTFKNSARKRQEDSKLYALTTILTPLVVSKRERKANDAS